MKTIIESVLGLLLSVFVLAPGYLVLVLDELLFGWWMEETPLEILLICLPFFSDSLIGELAYYGIWFYIILAVIIATVYMIRHS